MFLALMILLANWYYIPTDSPSTPAKIESVDLKLKERELAITFLSLSEGEATLIQHPNGNNVLINSGNSKTRTELRQLLQLYNIEKIDKIIVTKESDLENLEWIMREYQIDQVFFGRKPLGEMIFNGDFVFETWKVGHSEELLPGLGVRVLGNETGMDLSLKFFHHNILLLDSFNTRLEKTLFSKELADTTVIKFPFIKKGFSLSKQLMEHLDPQTAIIFQERNEATNHFFQSLEEAWIDVYLARKHGTISIKLNEKSYEVLTISRDKK